MNQEVQYLGHDVTNWLENDELLADGELNLYTIPHLCAILML